MTSKYEYIYLLCDSFYWLQGDYSFTIGNLDKDDIFTDNSPSGKYSLNSLDKGKGKTVATYDSDDESKKQVAVISNPSTSSDPQKIYSPAACIFVAKWVFAQGQCNWQ